MKLSRFTPALWTALPGSVAFICGTLQPFGSPSSTFGLFGGVIGISAAISFIMIRSATTANPRNPE